MLMEEELCKSSEYKDIPMFVRKNFAFLRIHAQKLAEKTEVFERQAAGKIKDIYHMLRLAGGATDEQILRIQRLEEETEYENSVAIDENLEKVRQTIKRGERAAFISDMYLPSDTIRRLICKHAPDLVKVPIYVSCEHKSNKWNGWLFKVVHQLEQIGKEPWIHLGDNPEADVKGAMCAKKICDADIRGQLYEYPHLLSYEKMTIEKNGTSALFQQVVGAARNIRLQRKYTGASAIGCSYGGPLIYFYVSWVLEQCIQQGITRLYFMARDGYIPYRVAEFLIKKKNLGISIRYIYGSRKSWKPVTFTEKTDLRTLNLHTLNSFARYFDLETQELKFFIEPNQTYDYYDFIILNKYVSFKSYLQRTQQKKRESAVAYLRQEIDVSDENFAFVEINGTGLSQYCVAALMKEFYHGKVRNFFMSLDFIRVNINNLFAIYSYSMTLGNLNAFLENYTRAPHGITVGYRTENDTVVPVLNDEETAYKIDFDAYINGVMEFTYTFFDIRGICHDLNVLKKYIDEELIIKDEELLAFHNSIIHDVFETKKQRKLIPMLTYWDICKMFLYSFPLEGYDRFLPAISLNLSILRSGHSKQKFVAFCKRHNNTLLGKICRLPRSFQNREYFLQYWKNVPLFNSRKEKLLRRMAKLIKGSVVIYGAGEYGQILYKSLNKQCVFWADKNYKAYNKSGNTAVGSPKEIFGKEYAVLVIAISDETTAAAARKELIEMGVESEKLKWIWEICNI